MKETRVVFLAATFCDTKEYFFFFLFYVTKYHGGTAQFDTGRDGVPLPWVGRMAWLHSLEAKAVPC